MLANTKAQSLGKFVIELAPFFAEQPDASGRRDMEPPPFGTDRRNSPVSAPGRGIMETGLSDLGEACLISARAEKVTNAKAAISKIVIPRIGVRNLIRLTPQFKRWKREK